MIPVFGRTKRCELEIRAFEMKERGYRLAKEKPRAKGPGFAQVMY